MAVEIPVVIDIDKAFQDAAKRVSAAMAPLQRELSGNALDFKIGTVDIDENKVDVTLRKIKEEGAETFGGLSQLISVVNRRLSQLAAEGDKINFTSALEVKHYLEDMATSSKTAQLHIDGLANSLQGIRANINAARATLETAPIKSDEWNNAAISLEKYKKELKDTEDAIRMVSADQAKVDFSPYIDKAAEKISLLEDSVKRLSAEMKGFMTRKEMTFFPADPETIEKARKGYERVTSALLEAQSALNRMSGFQQHIQELSTVNIQLLQMRDHYERLEEESKRMATSIEGYQIRLNEINQQWRQMTAEEKFTSNGQLTSEARALYESFKKQTEEMEKQAAELSQIYQKEQRRTQLAERGAQKRRYENAILNASVTSMRVLQEQERILSDRLNRTNIKSSKYAELSEQLEQVRAKMQQLQGEASRTSVTLSKQSRVMQNLTSMASMYVSVFGALRFVKQIREVTAELEYQRVALGHLLQDEEYGAALFERIKNAALESPFRIKDLVTYTKQLAAYRIAQEDLFDTTKKLADVSAGLGVDMNRLILAYGQVRAASVLRGQELRQFTEAGIPLVDLLADKFEELGRKGTTTADVFKLISERAVPFSMIADIFEDLTEKGGMFYDMQKIQADTLKGKWEKLKDAFDIGLQSIGESQGLLDFNFYMNGLLKLLTLLANNLRLVPKLLEGGTAAWLAYKAALILTHKATRAVIPEQVKLTAAQAATSAGAKAGSFQHARLTAAYIAQQKAGNALTRTLASLRVALWSNPWTAAISAVLGLATAFLSFKKSADDASTSINGMEVAIENMSKANKAFDRTDALINRYEALAKNTNRTADENYALTQSMVKLREQFPDLIDVIGAENVALDEQIDKLDEANKKRLENAKQSAREELALEEERNKGLQESYEQALEKYNQAYKKFIEAQKSASNTENINAALSDFLSEEDAEKLSSYEKPIRDMAESARKAREELDGVSKSLDESNSKIKRLEEQIDPTAVQKTWFEWQNQIKSTQDSLLKLGDTPVFTDEEIGEFSSVYDLSKKLKKKIDDLTTSIKGMRTQFDAITDKKSTAAQALEGEISASEKTLEIAEAIRLSLGLVFGKSKSGTRQTDPFITQMQERMKFMQDFKKGYDDLRKYMTSSQALSEEAGVMLGRGTSLGMSAEEQARAASDLSKWYDDAIKAVQDKLKAKGVKGVSVTDFLGIDTTKKSKDIQDLQKLLQSLWDAKTDFDISQKKKDLEDALKKLSDEIKRSETARNFYNDILDLTGDEQLAATMGVSIYGDVGQDFKERLQGELNKALESVDASAITDELRKAFSTQNFSVILANLDKFPEEWQKRLKEMAANSEKFQADEAKNLVKALERAKSYGEQRVEIAKKTAQRTAQIQAMNISKDAKSQLLKQNEKKEAEDSAKLAYEAFKDTPMYVELFANLDEASGRMLRNMRENLEGMKQNWKDLHPRELKELQSRLNELDEQIAQRNPFKALVESIKQYRKLQKQQTRAEADQAAVNATQKYVDEQRLLDVYAEEYNAAVALGKAGEADAMVAKEKMEAQAKVVDLAKEEAEEAQDTANSYRVAAKHITDAAEKMQDWAGYVSDSLDGIGQIVSTFASDDVAETFDIIAEGIGKTIGGAAQLGKGIAELIMLNPQGIVDTIQGLGSMISGIFGTKSQLSIKAINKKIDEQDRLLSQLTYSYGRLEAAMAKAFGSDYIYNYTEQLKNLQAQQAAYEEQARLERSKAKNEKQYEKRYKETTEEFLQSAKEVEDQILEMRGKLAEFFAGSDLTSAAEDFANAWIEAYMEFGSTTDAISEKFKDMVNNMIVKSLAGAAMQNLLKPVFDEIDNLAIDGELTAAEIGRISAMATAAIPQINDAMTGLMNNLTTAGIDLRTHAGQFTGISRDIAGASEESILGLAAAVNTANFYISHVPAIAENVAAIRGALVGDTPANVRTTASEGPTYEDQMLGLMGRMPTIEQHLADLLTEFRRVVRSSGGSFYVAIR